MAASGSSDQAEHVSIDDSSGGSGSNSNEGSSITGSAPDESKDVSGALGAAVDFVG
jgi:hypothetical protein